MDTPKFPLAVPLGQRMTLLLLQLLLTDCAVLLVEVLLLLLLTDCAVLLVLVELLLLTETLVLLLLLSDTLVLLLLLDSFQRTIWPGSSMLVAARHSPPKGVPVVLIRSQLWLSSLRSMLSGSITLRYQAWVLKP